jgi:hypothetical protein
LIGSGVATIVAGRWNGDLELERLKRQLMALSCFHFSTNVLFAGALKLMQPSPVRKISILRATVFCRTAAEIVLKLFSGLRPSYDSEMF